METNNTTIAISPIDVDQMSLQIMDQQLSLFVVVYVLMASAAFLGNAFIAMILCKSRKRLNSHHYKLQLHLTSVAACLSFFCLTVVGVRRVSMTLGRVSDVGTTLRCGMIRALYDPLLVVENLNVTAIGLDRLIAVALPIRYKIFGSTSTYLYVAIGLPWTFALVCVGAKFGLYTDAFAKTQLIFCHEPGGQPEQYTQFAVVFALILSIATICIYVGAVVAWKLRFHFNQSSIQIKNELGYRLFLTSTADALVYCSTYFTGYVFVNFYVIPNIEKLMITIVPALGAFLFAAIIPRPFLVLVLNKDFWRETKSVLSNFTAKTLVVNPRENTSRKTISGSGPQIFTMTAPT